METIERSKVLEACRMLGFDPEDVLEMKLSSQVVTVTTFTRGPDGQRIRLQGEGYGKTTTEYPITPNEYGAEK